MDKVYAELVVNHKKLFSEVPQTLQEKVKKLLENYIDQNLITQEEFDSIIIK